MTQLDDSLLSLFMQGFFGYGSLSGTCWFIGMEEGGGSSVEEISRRLEAWRQRGMPDVDDVAEYHRAIGLTRNFDSPPRLQTTWGKLIRVYFGLSGDVPPDAEAVRTFQAHTFARRGSDTCLLELLPLPSPSTAVWLYGQCSSLPELESRDRYREVVAPRRAMQIRARIAHHKPKTVVFYGKGYASWWEQIAGTSFRSVPLEGSTAMLAERDGIRFAVADHPAATGITSAYFHGLGRLLRETTRS